MNSTKLQDMGTTGLAAYVKAGKNGRAKNMRRVHAERVLAERHPLTKYATIKRFRDLISMATVQPTSC